MHLAESSSHSIVEVSTSSATLMLRGDVPGVSPETLFRYWIEPALITRWWPTEAEIDARPGGQYCLSWPKMNWYLHGTYSSVEPGKELAFSWHWDHEPDATNETVTVRFESSPDGGSRLELTHGPYIDTPEGRTSRQGHLEGWLYFLQRLQALMVENVRRPIVGGNWKMNTTVFTAVELATELVRRVGEVARTDTVLFPPYPNLESVHRVINGSSLQLGAQDIFWEQSGAYTGEVSASMLSAVGCSWVIVGHSERRRLLGESSRIVNRKLHAALHGNMRVILAVGETGDERHAGRTEIVLAEQLRESLAGITADQMSNVVIAYEPVWAIGTGENATPDQAREAHTFVRHNLGELYGDEIASQTRIQYGGSVTAANAAELLSEPGIDGALVGGASLKLDEFTAIVEAAGAG